MVSGVITLHVNKKQEAREWDAEEATEVVEISILTKSFDYFTLSSVFSSMSICVQV